jgi:hypothetical protein
MGFFSWKCDATQVVDLYLHNIHGLQSKQLQSLLERKTLSHIEYIVKVCEICLFHFLSDLSVKCLVAHFLRQMFLCRIDSTAEYFSLLKVCQETVITFPSCCVRCFKEYGQLDWMRHILPMWTRF